MKKLLLMLLLFVGSFGLCCACDDEKKTAEDGSSNNVSGDDSWAGSFGGSNSDSDSSITFLVTASAKLYDYDPVTQTSTGTEIPSMNIEAGKRYKLVFDFDFKNKNAIVGNNTISAKMKVTLGDFENEDNRVHLTSENRVDGGLGFSFKNNGEWETTVVITKNGELPDFTKSYFIVGIDSLGTSGSSVSSFQPVKVSFSSSNNNYSINGSSSYSLTLAAVKGTLDFTSENLVRNIGVGVPSNNLNIEVPIQSNEIKITYYKDSSKEETYGTVSYTEFVDGKLVLNLSEIMYGYMGDNYYTALGSGEIKPLLKVVAVGGVSYNDAVVEYEFELR